MKHWDAMNPMERLQLVMQHRDIFSNHHLVSQSELNAVDAMHESAREYVVDREDQPIFTSLNLKQALAVQIHRERLRAALQQLSCILQNM